MRDETLFSNCTVCGTVVYRPMSERRKNINGKYFCSRSCSAKYWNSVSPKRTKKIRPVTKKERPPSFCRICGCIITKESSYANNNGTCKQCNKIDSHRRRKKIIHDAKVSLGGKCSACGENNFDVLDIHHLLDKKYGAWQMSCQKREERERELSKCILLCANCHFEEHIPRNKPAHGSFMRTKLSLVNKNGNACLDCGLVADFRLYVFHHIDPSSKSFSLSRERASLENTYKEAEKCVMLCRNCHRKRHAVPRDRIELSTSSV